MPPQRRAKPSPRTRRPWLRRLLLAGGVLLFLTPLAARGPPRWARPAGGALLSPPALAAGVASIWAFTVLPRSLPSVSALENFEPSRGTKVFDENDELVTEFHVERRIFTPLTQIPKALKAAIIATEDTRFYSHYGVDPMGVARGSYHNFRHG